MHGLWSAYCQSVGEVMITRRQQRYSKLRHNGFCAFEAKPLSEIPIKIVPYMKPLIRERRRMFAEALRDKLTAAQWEAQIKAYYFKHRFLKPNRLGKDVPNPWAMVKDFEDKYKDKYPVYESPGPKKRRIWGDFMAKIERTIATQSQRRLRRAPA